MKPSLAQQLKSESMLKRLEDEGINVNSLKKNLNKKQDGTSEGISK